MLKIDLANSSLDEKSEKLLASLIQKYLASGILQKLKKNRSYFIDGKLIRLSHSILSATMPGIDYDEPTKQCFLVVDEILGRGGFGTVKLSSKEIKIDTGKITLTTEHDRVIKSFRKSECKLEDVNLEHSLTQEIYPKTSAALTITPKKLYCVQPKLGTKSLTAFKDLPTHQKLVICYNLIRKLVYLHSKNLLHRDIKPANILVDEQTLEVFFCDMGLSIKDPGVSKGDFIQATIIGTPNYMAPEIFEFEVDACGISQFNKKTDFYALAGTVACFLADNVFSEKKEKTQLNAISEKPYNYKDIEALLKAFIETKQKKSVEAFVEQLKCLGAQAADERPDSIDKIADTLKGGFRENIYRYKIKQLKSLLINNIDVHFEYIKTELDYDLNELEYIKDKDKTVMTEEEKFSKFLTNHFEWHLTNQVKRLKQLINSPILHGSEFNKRLDVLNDNIRYLMKVLKYEFHIKEFNHCKKDSLVHARLITEISKNSTILKLSHNLNGILNYTTDEQQQAKKIAAYTKLKDIFILDEPSEDISNNTKISQHFSKPTFTSLLTDLNNLLSQPNHDETNPDDLYELIDNLNRLLSNLVEDKTTPFKELKETVIKCLTSKNPLFGAIVYQAFFKSGDNKVYDTITADYLNQYKHWGEILAIHPAIHTKPEAADVTEKFVNDDELRSLLYENLGQGITTDLLKRHFTPDNPDKLQPILTGFFKMDFAPTNPNKPDINLLINIASIEARDCSILNTVKTAAKTALRLNYPEYLKTTYYADLESTWSLTEEPKRAWLRKDLCSYVVDNLADTTTCQLSLVDVDIDVLADKTESGKIKDKNEVIKNMFQSIKRTILDCDWGVKFPGGEVIKTNTTTKRIPTNMFKLLAIINKAETDGELKQTDRLLETSEQYKKINPNQWLIALTEAKTLLSEANTALKSMSKLKLFFYDRSDITTRFYQRMAENITTIAPQCRSAA